MSAVWRTMRAWLDRSVLGSAPDATDTAAARRRRWVVLGTGVAGSLVLAILLRLDHGSEAFVVCSLVLAAVWAGGARLSGPLPLVTGGLARPVVQGAVLGAGLAAVFVVGALVLREIDPLAEQVRGVLDYADAGSGAMLVLVTVVNGLAEELFFRGAVYAALPSHRIAWSTLIYVAVTAASGNVMLGFAAVLLGLLAAGQRRATGGVLAPAITHVVWSVAMLVLLPVIL